MISLWLSRVHVLLKLEKTEDNYKFGRSSNHGREVGSAWSTQYMLKILSNLF